MRQRSGLGAVSVALSYTMRSLPSDPWSRRTHQSKYMPCTKRTGSWSVRRVLTFVMCHSLWNSESSRQLWKLSCGITSGEMSSDRMALMTKPRASFSTPRAISGVMD